MSLLIALDYDDTVTADFPLWRSFIFNAVASGHSVVIVTSRMSPPSDIRAALPDLDVYQTFGEAKKPFMAKHGLHPDIWIDNHPEILTQNASWYRGGDP